MSSSNAIILYEKVTWYSLIPSLTLHKIIIWSWILNTDVNVFTHLHWHGKQSFHSFIIFKTWYFRTWIIDRSEQLQTFQEPLSTIETLRWQFIVAKWAKQLTDENVSFLWCVPHSHVTWHHLHHVTPHLIPHVLQPARNKKSCFLRISIPLHGPQLNFRKKYSSLNSSWSWLHYKRSRHINSSVQWSAV